MNKIILLIGGLLAYSYAGAYHVSTEIQKKKILLEVFTGIHCGNCPDGDFISNNLWVAQPDNVYVVDIHANYYAVPGAGEPDYRIEEGELLDADLGANNYGYPCGAINRRDYSEFSYAPYILSRSSWGKKAKETHQQEAPVNLWLQSEWDGATRTLKITVEGYYTAQVENEFNLLNIAITQDNILGPQSGGGLGNNYNHRHTLRAFVTPAWGDTIAAPKQGDYFSREYTYILPESVRDVPLHAEEIEVLAFVTKDKKEVLNITGAKPGYSNYSKPLAAKLQAPDFAIANQYAYTFFEAKLKSETDVPVTSADFQVTVNGTVQPATWEGTIPAFHTQAIQIAVNDYTVNDQNTYEVQLTSLNGQPVAGDKLSGTFAAPATTTPTILVEIKTDLFAEENLFRIKDREGQIVHEFGPYAGGENTLYKETVELEADKYYCFEVIDLWADGLATNPRGYYVLRNADNTLIIQAYEVKTLGARTFFYTGLQGTDIPVVKAQENTPVEISIYTLSGQRISGLQHGINIVKYQAGDRTWTEKVILP
ncbi:hypothetical protein FACS189474_4500 [Bacteroidia bacterium]|nr:hypothetical protein FACS189474_4500 [Bacteroidia bacterium]